MERFLLSKRPVSVTHPSPQTALPHKVKSTDAISSRNQTDTSFNFNFESNRNLNMRLKILACVLVVTSTLLTACETMTSSRRLAISTSIGWALLPFENLSQTPLAGDRARSLVETHLHANGVTNLAIYQPASEQSLLSLLDNAAQLEAGKQWARDNGYRFAVTGNVQEWQYKNGLDNEPSVGMTLKFLDLYNNEVLWVASASRTGWGYSNLSSVASKTIKELLAEVRFKPSKSTAPDTSPVIAANRPIIPRATPAVTTRIQPMPLVPREQEPEIAAAKPPKVMDPPALLPSMIENTNKEVTDR
ncbi:hypothetical protein AB833_19745 [Chromatiales bacterium (ex Bugula neritina AB1)]|nr:hypothetical protein AB833_19745 [Chromatiales bacterium (ex Bugula neritina AB1)]